MSNIQQSLEKKENESEKTKQKKSTLSKHLIVATSL